jgi:hypothetical protein
MDRNEECTGRCRPLYRAARNSRKLAMAYWLCSTPSGLGRDLPGGDFILEVVMSEIESSVTFQARRAFCSRSSHLPSLAELPKSLRQAEIDVPYSSLQCALKSASFLYQL